MNSNDKDKDIHNILSELNEEQGTEGFNKGNSVFYLEYFNNKNDSTTPQNTPSAKQNQNFTLKNIDFDKYIPKNEYDSYASNDLRQNFKFCSSTYIGNGSSESGCTTSESDKKVN